MLLLRTALFPSHSYQRPLSILWSYLYAVAFLLHPAVAFLLQLAVAFLLYAVAFLLYAGPISCRILFECLACVYVRSSAHKCVCACQCLCLRNRVRASLGGCR